MGIAVRKALRNGTVGLRPCQSPAVLVVSGLAPLVFPRFRFLQNTASCAHQQFTGAAMKITVYSKSACPQCDAAKKLLTAKGMAYEEVMLDDEAGSVAFYEK